MLAKLPAFTTSFPKTLPGDTPAQWTPDGKSLLISGAEIPARVFVMDLA